MKQYVNIINLSDIILFAYVIFPNSKTEVL